MKTSEKTMGEKLVILNQRKDIVQHWVQPIQQTASNRCEEKHQNNSE